jgi:hypothetical protein
MQQQDSELFTHTRTADLQRGAHADMLPKKVCSRCVGFWLHFEASGGRGPHRARTEDGHTSTADVKERIERVEVARARPARCTSCFLLRYEEPWGPGPSVQWGGWALGVAGRLVANRLPAVPPGAWG